ncbi:MAG: tetratricopeptide repeat protein [Pirellulaceae bacterium]
MFAYRRIRRKQILREAEGYLDLAMVFWDRWPLSARQRDRLAQRALDALARIESAGACRPAVSFLRGQALRVMGRYREAIETLEHSAELDPENIHIWLALGWCFKRTGRLDLAIQSLEEALAVEERQAVVYYNLACYWSLAHNSKLALAYLAQALDLDPSYRDLIAGESDFDPIRNDPGFRDLTSVIV